MRDEATIREFIYRLINVNEDILNKPRANIVHNLKEALKQIIIVRTLDTLYVVLEEKRPIFNCEK